MSKALEALEGLHNCTSGDGWLQDRFCDEWKDEIEKELKALEIIKEKRVDVDCLMDCFPYDGFISTTGRFEYNRSLTWGEKELTQEEYDLLKEVLK